jgi:hypothetical protein
MMVRHLDGHNTNDRLDNLAWGTASENQQDAVRHGTQSGLKVRGESTPNHKITEADVIEIRRLAGTMPQRAIGELVGLTQTTVGQIIRRQAWKHVA